RRAADRLPEFAQPFHPPLGRVAGDDRRVQRADRDAGQPVRLQAGLVQRLEHAGLVGAECAAALQHQRDGAVVAGYRFRQRRHCMNQPWLTTIDWPVSAAEGKVARYSAVCAMSSTVVKVASTVSFSITFLITSSSVMPSSLACSGICFSTSGVRTKPGQITCERTLCGA